MTFSESSSRSRFFALSRFRTAKVVPTFAGNALVNRAEGEKVVQSGDGGQRNQFAEARFGGEIVLDRLDFGGERPVGAVELGVAAGAVVDHPGHALRPVAEKVHRLRREQRLQRGEAL